MKTVTFEYDKNKNQLHFLGTDSGRIMASGYVDPTDETLAEKVLSFLEVKLEVKPSVQNE